MNNESKIIIIRGNSGSGKSTVARGLQRRFGRGTLLIPQDIIRRELLWVNDGEGTKAVPLLLDLIMYGKNNCEVVILEGILNSQWYKEVFQKVKDEFSCIHAYYYDIPFSETVKRHSTKPNRNDFGEADMRKWWNEKDFIGFIKEKLITKEMSLDDTINMIYEDVANS